MFKPFSSTLLPKRLLYRITPNQPVDNSSHPENPGNPEKNIKTQTAESLHLESDDTAQETFDEMRSLVDRKDHILHDLDSSIDQFNNFMKEHGIVMNIGKFSTMFNSAFYELNTMEKKKIFLDSFESFMEKLKSIASNVEDVSIEDIRKQYLDTASHAQNLSKQMQSLGFGVDFSNDFARVSAEVGFVLCIFAVLIGGAIGAIFGAKGAVVGAIIGACACLILSGVSVYYTMRYPNHKINYKNIKRLYSADKDTLAYDILNEFMPNVSRTQFDQIADIYKKNDDVNYRRITDYYRQVEKEFSSRFADKTITDNEFQEIVKELKIWFRPA